MILERIQGALMLHITPELCIYFRSEWVEQLRALPYDQFGEFIRSTIYPSLSDKERRLWNKTTINNRDLQAAVQAAI
ncbi:MAG: hypothetical protein GX556_11070 [Fibrobacter sp.]|nr:hypothetical protein [Fibrobacter sp.]